jgi:hypothetical protein
MDNPKNPWTDTHMRSYILGLEDIPEDHFSALSKRVLQTFSWRPTVVDILELHEDMFPTPAKGFADPDYIAYENQRALILDKPKRPPTKDDHIRSQNLRRRARGLPPMNDQEIADFVETIHAN